jgi:16S rRNA processing protein RimM
VDQKEADSFIAIGVIVSAVGLRGEVRCSLLTDFPKRFEGLSHVMVATKEGERCPYSIVRVRFSSGFVYLRLEGVTSRDIAEQLRGRELQIPEEERSPLPKDHYYRYEIVGLDVFSEEGRFLGKVDSILETGGNDIYLVKQDTREYLIPAIKSVVKKIDLLKREMTIFPMEGLLDL